jgi:hypothetical protein
VTKDFTMILEMGSERVVADLAVKVMEKSPESLREMLDLCWLEKYPLSMRAARAAQLYLEIHHEEIYPFLEEIIEKILNTKIEGVRRNFLKVIADFVDIEKIKEPGILLNAGFDWLSDGSSKPGTKIHSMTIIYKIGCHEPDILRELAATIGIVMDESEISMKTCGRKMLSRINKQLAVGSRQSAVGSR